jgi:hypothetical protein
VQGLVRAEVVQLGRQVHSQEGQVQHSKVAKEISLESRRMLQMPPLAIACSAIAAPFPACGLDGHRQQSVLCNTCHQYIQAVEDHYFA